MELKEKEIERGKRSFLIKKFTPKVACFWAFRLFGTAAGALPAILAEAANTSDEGKKKAKSVAAQKIQEFIAMEWADFGKLQADCLGRVYCRIDGRSFSVVDANGMIMEELDSPLVFSLMLDSFMFSMMDFFGAEALSGIGAALTPIFQKIGSTNSSTSPSDSNTGNSENSGTEPTTSPTFSTSSI